MVIQSKEDGFNDAVQFLKRGGVVAAPTETVYGLAADACDSNAVSRIYAAKGRPQNNPLIIHVDGIDMAKKYAHFSPTAKKLARHFWAGPLTLVLPKVAGGDVACVAENVTAGLDTIAVRHPKGVMSALVSAVGSPLAAPSANPSGKVSATNARHIQADFGDGVDLILDGGQCDIGLESTIVKVDGDEVTLLRHGAITKEKIEAVMKVAVGERSPSGCDAGVDIIESPGQMRAHYAPDLPVRLNADKPEKNEAWLCLGRQEASYPNSLNLSAVGDLDEAAKNLFDMLRRLDKSGSQSGMDAIAVQSVPMEGVGVAINDRLNRAAHATGISKE